MSDKKIGKRVLIVDLTRRLPDIDQESVLPEDLERYGRCAVLRNGAFWTGGLHASHPPSTVAGFYWATGAETRRGDRSSGACEQVSDATVLYISPRGATVDLERYVDESFVRELARRIALRMPSRILLRS